MGICDQEFTQKPIEVDPPDMWQIILEKYRSHDCPERVLYELKTETSSALPKSSPEVHMPI